jgi:hypothetical protein
MLILVSASSCSLLKYSKSALRKDRIIECVRNFTDDDIDVEKAYKVCYAIYKKGVR